MTTMTASEARAALPEVLDRVIAGEEVTITRHGQPVAVVVRPDTLRSRRGDQAFAVAAEIHDLLEAGRRGTLPRSKGLSKQQAEELLTQVRAGRKSG